MMRISSFCITTVLFDFDGTLTLPGALDFPAIRTALGCPLDQPLLEFIQSLGYPREQKKALDQLACFETRAAHRSRPNEGAVETVAWIKRSQMAVGILTRNSRASVLTGLQNFGPIGPQDFDIIITRDDPPAPKPSGQGIRWAARVLQTEPQEILMVGDFAFDCQAGRDAGARTVLLDPHHDPQLQAVACDFRIERLKELQAILQPVCPVDPH